MGNTLLSLMLAAGVAGVAYSQLGKRVGYGNEKSVWTLVGIAFGMTFVILMIVLNYMIDLGN